MTLAPDFQFSQGSLQDYVDCPRRCQLRYIMRLAWPAVQAEPVAEYERHQQLGQTFHRMVHQHLLGVPVESLSRFATEPDLARWWQHYVDDRPAEVGAARYPELSLSTPVAGYRLVAKYDLVALTPGKQAIIFDWKTARKPTPRNWLATRLQTRVYRYVWVCAGTHLNNGLPVLPEQVAMVYWFAELPHAPERFPYNADGYASDAAYLTALIEEIAHRPEGDFPLTGNERHCRYCPYRSLCERGVQAGDFSVSEEALETELDGLGLDIDFEQIAEIEF